MGLELKTVARQGSVEALGKLYLDSKQLRFTSKELKFCVELGPSLKVSTEGTLLVISQTRSKISFELGSALNQWVKKIRNPPSRIDKLGVKPGMRCWLGGRFEAAFQAELKAAGATMTKQIPKCSIAFRHIAHRDQLDQLIECCEALPAKTNLWVVWPKGNSDVTQAEVLSTVQRSGFGPSKTASFSQDLSSMRFARK